MMTSELAQTLDAVLFLCRLLNAVLDEVTR